MIRDYNGTAGLDANRAANRRSYIFPGPCFRRRFDIIAGIMKAASVFKETYFTPDAIRSKALEMIPPVEAVGRRRDAGRFRPAAAALLVLDMQAGFLRESGRAFIPSAPVIVPGLRKLVRLFAAAGRPVIFTRHTNTPADAGQLAQWWRDLFKPDSGESAIIPELEAAEGRVVEKHQYDAFHQTELEPMLRAVSTEQVVIAGVMTHLCCETTARSAFGRGFEVFFSVDGTATYTEAFHRAAVLNLAHGFAVPVLIEEIAGAFL
jgi:nicotinamidase-related amidase